jgi:hypothetical protein
MSDFRLLFTFESFLECIRDIWNGTLDDFYAGKISHQELSDTGEELKKLLRALSTNQEYKIDLGAEDV